MDTYNSENTISLWDNNNRSGITLRNIQTGKRYSFVLKHSFTVGSNKNFCDLQITTEDRYMSKKHLRFIKKEDGIYAEDLNSKNGSRINGKTISSRVRIKKGDILKIGRSEFEITI